MSIESFSYSLDLRCYFQFEIPWNLHRRPQHTVDIYKRVIEFSLLSNLFVTLISLPFGWKNNLFITFHFFYYVLKVELLPKLNISFWLSKWQHYFYFFNWHRLSFSNDSDRFSITTLSLLDTSVIPKKWVSPGSQISPSLAEGLQH